MTAPPRLHCAACEEPGPEGDPRATWLCNHCAANEPLRCAFPDGAAAVVDPGRVVLGGFRMMV